MNSSQHRTSVADNTEEMTPFERQRALLVNQVAQTMEQIITNMNQLNRNLESVISVGKEFESVSTLWRSFHDVIGEDVSSNDKSTNGNGEHE